MILNKLLWKNRVFFWVHSITLHTFVYIFDYVKEKKKDQSLLSKDSTNTLCVEKKTTVVVQCDFALFFTRNMQSSQFMRLRPFKWVRKCFYASTANAIPYIWYIGRWLNCQISTAVLYWNSAWHLLFKTNPALS